MNSSMPTQTIDRATVIVSVPAFLLWVGVLAFLAKWFRAWAAGRLEPGANTSMEALFVVFLLASLGSVGGIYMSVRAWRRKSELKWQAGSLIAGVLMLWAVSGG